MKNKKVTSIATIIIAVAAALYQYLEPSITQNNASENTNQPTIDALFAKRQSNIVVEVEGRVIKLLADDNEGSRHQKFIIRLPSNHTVLISHNIDLAPRINTIKEGQLISVKGEYEWTAKGGVIHWTHHDPRGQHEGGWIEYKGKRYD